MLKHIFYIYYLHINIYSTCVKHLKSTYVYVKKMGFLNICMTHVKDMFLCVLIIIFNICGHFPVTSGGFKQGTQPTLRLSLVN